MKKLKIEKYNRVEAYTRTDILEENLKLGISLGCSDVEIATSFSHIKAIKTFLEESDKEYAIICEDDADLTNIEKIMFSVEDLFKTFKDTECFQLASSTREDIDLNFVIHERTDWDFNTTVYAINKKYAKGIVDRYYVDNNFSLNNFVPIDILDYRNDQYIKSQPVSEYVVYESEKTLSCSLFSYTLSESSIQTSEESKRQNIKSKKDTIFYWNNFENIFISNLLGQRSLAWITLTNGRKDLLRISRPSWYKYLDGIIDIEIIIDDSGSQVYREWLANEYPLAIIVPVGDENQGYKKAMQKCFDIAKNTKCEYILHTEDDFLLNEKIETYSITEALRNNQILSQIALTRQPWYDHERTKNSIIESIESEGYTFIEKQFGNIFYLENSHYWTCNPNIYPSKVATFDWPDTDGSELEFTKKIFSLGYKSAFYGKREDKHQVSHIGHYRLGGNH